jgi:hypothetical protein
MAEPSRSPLRTASATPGDEDAVPGRVAFLDALREGIETARGDGSRLSAAVLESEAIIDDPLATRLRETADAPVYLIGPRSVALVLPGLGRAAALGILARVEAAHGLQGRVVEPEPGEDAVEVAVRVLGRGSVPEGD